LRTVRVCHVPAYYGRYSGPRYQRGWTQRNQFYGEPRYHNDWNGQRGDSSDEWNYNGN